MVRARLQRPATNLQPENNKGQQLIRVAGLYRCVVPKGRLELPRPYGH
jgi:hypothetical protein